MQENLLHLDDDRPTSKCLAIRIADALILAGLVPRDKFDRAIRIAESEIDAYHLDHRR
jgi:hypothetical protein